MTDASLEVLLFDGSPDARTISPNPLAVESMISVPYAVMLNDISIFVTGSHTGGACVQMLCDHLDQLLADSESSGRVMALAIHPFVINQPSLHRYLAQALEEIQAREGVWITTSHAIAQYYATTEIARRMAGTTVTR